MGTILIKPLEVSIGTFFTFSFFIFFCIPSSTKTAICLAICCFLLIFRFELGNATKTQYAKLKRANFYEKADEHVERNKRGKCRKWWGKCQRSGDCCGTMYCSFYKCSYLF